MADSSIEWTDKTWNPTRGCKLISPGCANCYAMRFAHRFSGPGGRYEGLTELGPQGPRWTGRARLVREQLEAPLSWKKPKRIFVDSMSDLFHGGLDFEEIAAVFGVMASCPQHTFQILTKRPERMVAFFRWLEEIEDMRDDGPHGPWPTWVVYTMAVNLCCERVVEAEPARWPLPNVHLGVSVEDRKHGLPRIELLRQVPAALRFLSCEPLLEDLGHLDLEGIGWVIVGGESGYGARAFDPDWARAIVAQCRAARVAPFVKQMGRKPVGLVKLRSKKGNNPKEWPADLRVREVVG